MNEGEQKMPVLPSHTVNIDGNGFFAQQVQSDKPFKEWKYEEVPIQAGEPYWYRTTLTLRKLSFSTTIQGNIEEIRDMLEGINNKVVPFSSVYIGAFYALIMIKMQFPDAFPGVILCQFDVQEVKELE